MNVVSHDPHGYRRLLRALDFLVVEAEVAGFDAGALRTARKFAIGSPTEFLGESLMALENLLNGRDQLPLSVAAFAQSVVVEIQEGFRSGDQR